MYTLMWHHIADYPGPSPPTCHIVSHIDWPPPPPNCVTSFMNGPFVLKFNFSIMAVVEEVEVEVEAMAMMNTRVAITEENMVKRSMSNHLDTITAKR